MKGPNEIRPRLQPTATLKVVPFNLTARVGMICLEKKNNDARLNSFQQLISPFQNETGVACKVMQGSQFLYVRVI